MVEFIYRVFRLLVCQVALSSGNSRITKGLKILSYE